MIIKIKRIVLCCILILSITFSFGQIYIRRGNSKQGTIIYRYDESTKKVREGQSSFVKIVFTKDNNRIRLGQAPYGKVKYTIDGNFIREGDNKFGKILYNIDGCFIREGSSKCGKIIYYIDK